MIHPNIVATYGCSIAATCGSISEFEKYSICIVSILLDFTLSPGVVCAFLTICAQATCNVYGIVARPAV